MWKNEVRQIRLECSARGRGSCKFDRLHNKALQLLQIGLGWRVDWKELNGSLVSGAVLMLVDQHPHSHVRSLGKMTHKRPRVISVRGPFP